MPIFRREKLHERLAREGGLTGELGTEPLETIPRWSPTSLHGTPHRPRRWDVVTTAQASGIPADAAELVVLEDAILVESDLPDGVLEPLANAIEERIDPPYRAEAIRRHDDVWAVAACRIEVAQLPHAEGDELALTVSAEGRRFLVDGAYSFGTVPELERIAGARFPSYVAEASRIDGDLWELRVTPL